MPPTTRQVFDEGGNTKLQDKFLDALKAQGPGALVEAYATVVSPDGITVFMHLNSERFEMYRHHYRWPIDEPEETNERSRT